MPVVRRRLRGDRGRQPDVLQEGAPAPRRAGGDPETDSAPGLTCASPSPPAAATPRAERGHPRRGALGALTADGSATASSAATKACSPSTASCRSVLARGPRDHPPGRHHPRHHQPRQSLPLRHDATSSGEEHERDRSDDLVAAFQASGFDALVSIGGDGSLQISHDLWRKGLPVVCVPKTIDNDVSGTQRTFGFDTAVSTATEAIDKLHSTAESHDRVIVVELMGRYAGWIALYSGLSGSADVILIPEIPFDIEQGVREDPEPRGRRAPLQHRRRGGGRAAAGRHDRAARAPRRRHGRPARRHREQGGARRSSTTPARRRGRSSSVTCSGAARPRRTTGCSRSASAPRPCGRSPTGPSARWWGSTGRRSRGCRSITSSAGPRTSRSTPTRSAPRAIWESAWVTEPAYPPTRTVDVDRVLHGETIPDPYRWLEDGDAPETTRLDRAAERAHRGLPRRASRRGRRSARRLDELLAIGAISTPTPARGRYFYQRREGRQNQPVLYVREGVDGERPGGCRPERARSRRHDRARLVLPERRRPAARLRPVRERQRAERAARARRRMPAPASRPDSRAPAPPTSPGCPTPSGFYYTRYPAPGECRTGRSTTTARSTSTRWAAIPPTTRWSTSPARKEYWPGVSLSPDGRWLLIGVARTFDQTDLYLGDRAAGGRPSHRSWPSPRTCRPRSRARWRTAGFPPHQPRRADLPAVRGGSEHPDAGPWRELVPPRDGRGAGGCYGRWATGWR